MQDTSWRLFSSLRSDQQEEESEAPQARSTGASLLALLPTMMLTEASWVQHKSRSGMEASRFSLAISRAVSVAPAPGLETS